VDLQPGVEQHPPTPGNGWYDQHFRHRNRLCGCMADSRKTGGLLPQRGRRRIHPEDEVAYRRRKKPPNGWVIAYPTSLANRGLGAQAAAEHAGPAIGGGAESGTMTVVHRPLVHWVSRW